MANYSESARAKEVLRSHNLHSGRALKSKHAVLMDLQTSIHRGQRRNRHTSKLQDLTLQGQNGEHGTIIRLSVPLFLCQCPQRSKAFTAVAQLRQREWVASFIFCIVHLPRMAEHEWVVITIVSLRHSVRSVSRIKGHVIIAIERVIS
ncbi:hypothetical protein KP509_22G014600 [Ceratopteris richardii]|uniref:Uncharacterized protein n=1 Tax=Ceratopteris richardii TaxID=49495 RepID=A0A8T2S5G8_CERRI|nr:hypothetical protein KP509_22G014600 [Ceratopteris richardii]